MLRTVHRRVLICFFLSGLTALIYQVLWTRRLSLTFGHTVLAVSTVLTVFMAGLAAGSLVAGYWCDKRRREPLSYLRAYGMVEAFTGLWAVLSLGLLSLVEQGYFAVARSGVSGTGLHLVCFAGSFLVLFPPTLAMGASMPLISKMLILEERRIGSLLSQIYGVNTLGAFAGAAIGGFILLPTLGLRGSMMLAGAFNVGIGIFAVWQARNLWNHPENAVLEAPAALDDEQPVRAEGSWLVPAAFGLAGVASMIYQVGWTRGLVLAFGSSIYCFSLILTAFLAGLGLGSLLYSRLLQERRPSLLHLVVLQLVIASFGCALILAIGRLPLLGAFLVTRFGHHYLSMIAVQFVVVFLIFLLPTVAMGLAFPLATHLYNSNVAGLGKTLGQVYGANTLGCILGSFAAGFWLIPQMGSQHSLKLAVAINLLNAGALYLGYRGQRGPNARPVTVAAVIVLVAGITWLSPPWDTRLMSAGAGISRQSHSMSPLAFYQDGMSCTVAVGFNAPWQPYLKVNGKTDASVDPIDMVPMYLIGYLPCVYHPDPKEIGVVGFGAGFTVDALTDCPNVKNIVCAELEPAVMAAAGFFAPFNGDATNDPRVQMKLTDGRTFLMGSANKFDVIVNQPSNPWIAGVGNLFSKEFYAACRSRLNPGGIMTQWCHIYSTSPDDLRQIIRTFYSEYAYGAVFRYRGDLILLGSETPLEFPLERMKQSLTWGDDVANNLVWLGLLDPQILLGFYAGDRETMIALAGPGLLNTDDRPLLEYSAPKSLFADPGPVNELLSRAAPLLPPGVAVDDDHIFYSLIGKIKASLPVPLEDAKKLLSGKSSWLFEYLSVVAVVEGPENNGAQPETPKEPNSRISLAVAPWYLRMGRPQDSLKSYQQVIAQPFPGATYSALRGAGDAARAQNQPPEAADYYEKAAPLTLSSEPLVKLAHVQRTTASDQVAIKTLGEALVRYPYDFQAYVDRGAIELDNGQIDAARADLQKATELGALGASWEDLRRRVATAKR